MVGRRGRSPSSGRIGAARRSARLAGCTGAHGPAGRSSRQESHATPGDWAPAGSARSSHPDASTTAPCPTRRLAEPPRTRGCPPRRRCPTSAPAGSVVLGLEVPSFHRASLLARTEQVRNGIDAAYVPAAQAAAASSAGESPLTSTAALGMPCAAPCSRPTAGDPLAKPQRTGRSRVRHPCMCCICRG